jgi:hypothetical protein
MRSAPTLKIWMTPVASVAMLEKFALLKIALCSAPAFRSASLRRTSVRSGAAATMLSGLVSWKAPVAVVPS